MARAASPILQASRLLRAGDLDGAERLCRQVLKRNRRSVDALQLLGAAAFMRGEYAAAADQYRKATRIRPGHAPPLVELGKSYGLLGRYDDALSCFDKALRIDPASREALGWKAGILERQGAYDDARRLLAPWFQQGRDDADMAELQARLDLHGGQYEDAIAVAGRYLGRDDITAAQRAALEFATGRAYEKLGDHDRSFEAFRRANEASPDTFDPDAYVALVDRILQAFDAQAMQRLPRSRHGSSVPVFIAGMPRSGTTLVEQIVDAHPRAYGAGEIDDVERIVGSLPQELGVTEPFPECIAALDQRAADRLGGRYLARLARLGRSSSRVLNKSLESYKHLGLIALLWPGARVIHCTRDPMDTCLSCYMGGIQPAMAPFVTSLEHLGVAYRQYRRLMEHWQRVLDLPILEVQYEQVVDDVQGATRRILEFLNLPWDDRCLRFYESGRPVLTLSYAQVTQPIYRSAVGRWRRYERHLKPLAAALDG